MPVKERIHTKVNHLSMNLLVSYFSILAIPLLSILIIYFTASNLLLSMQEEKVSTSLHMTALEIRQSIQEAGNLGVYLSSSNSLRELCDKITTKENFFDVYEYTRTLTDYTMFNEAIEDIYIFFQEGDYIVKNMAIVPSGERGYNSLGKLSEDTYEELMKLFRDKYYNQEVLLLENYQVTGKKLVVAQSFPFNTNNQAQGTLAIVLSDVLLNRQLSSNLINGDGIVFMIERNDSGGSIQKAVYGDNNLLDESQFDFSDFLEEEIGERKIQGETYIVCTVEDTVYPYSYITCLPKKTVLGQIGAIKYLIIILCATSIGIGIFICLELWRRRRNVVLAFSRYHDEFGTVQEGGKTIQNIWEGISYLLDSAVNWQTTLKLQTNFMRSAVIRKLLLGEYAGKEELILDLKSADIVLEGTGYYVAVLAIKHAFLNEDIEWSNDIRLCLKNLSEERILLPKYYCELDPFRAAMIFPVKKKDSLAIIKDTLMEFKEVLLAEKNLESYMGIGRGVSEQLEIATAYDDAREITDYLVFHDIRTVMEKEEMPKNLDNLFFPIETELLLVKCIKQANEMEIVDIFRMLEYENFTFRKLSVLMASHLIDLVRATIIRALREEERNFDKAIRQLERAETLPQLKEILEDVLPFLRKKKKEKESEKAEQLKKLLIDKVEEHYKKQNFTLNLLAEELGFTENNLYKQFKVLFGMSFCEYLENERIKKACELLKARVAVKDVAEAVGYCSDFTFRRAFKRVMGLAPSYYAEGLEEK